MVADHARLQDREASKETGLAVGAIGTLRAGTDDLPKNMNPRAISGDAVEPHRDRCVTITVAPKDAEIVGATNRAIQAAVDYVARREGGAVRILPGKDRLRNPIFHPSKVRLSSPRTLAGRERASPSAR